MPKSYSFLLCHSGSKSHTKKDGKAIRKTKSELSHCHMAVTAPQDTGSEESDSGTWEGGSWYLSVGYHLLWLVTILQCCWCPEAGIEILLDSSADPWDSLFIPSVMSSP